MILAALLLAPPSINGAQSSGGLGSRRSSTPRFLTTGAPTPYLFATIPSSRAFGIEMHFFAGLKKLLRYRLLDVLKNLSVIKTLINL